MPADVGKTITTHSQPDFPNDSWRVHVITEALATRAAQLERMGSTVCAIVIELVRFQYPSCPADGFSTDF
jgi:hypothetical protein